MDPDQAAHERHRLVTRLQANGRLSSRRVANAIATVPRHAFVPEHLRSRAYHDEPLPIGHDQVVTAPHLVAQMTELLELRPGHHVLEVGTGSGYHAAVIAELAGSANVITIERVPALAHTARTALHHTGYGDVTVIVADGSRGLPAHPPFDRITVACVTPTIPPPLLAQLRPDGRMVIPLGERNGSHELYLVTKHNGRVDRTPKGPVRFVPLIGKHGFPPHA